MDRRDRLTEWMVGRLTVLRVEPFGRAPEPRRALAGVDAAPHAPVAAAWAGALSPSVALLYAQRQGETGSGATPDAMERLAGEARAAFEAIEGSVGDVGTTRHVLDESPAKALTSAAEVLGVDLIVVPTRLFEGSDERDPGHVAEMLAHHTNHPVLFANDGPSDGEVLVGVAADRSSRDAAAWAVTVATTLDSPLRAVHATGADPEVQDHEDVVAFESRSERAEAVLDAGRPSSVLLGEIQDRDPSLVVIGHGRERGWIGSTTRALIEASPASVLVVPHTQDPVSYRI